jgi:hypothetical protein
VDKICQAIVKFAMRYAEVTHDDFRELNKAIQAGRVKAAA